MTKAKFISLGTKLYNQLYAG